MACTTLNQGRPTGGDDIDRRRLLGLRRRRLPRRLADRDIAPARGAGAPGHLAGRARVLLWSAGGDDYARDRAEQFGVDHLVSGYFSKEGRDADGRYLTTHLPARPGRVVFVDDRPEDLAAHVEVLAVSPYLAEDPHDRGLEQVARRAGLTGSSRR